MRGVAYEHYECTKERAKFIQLVNFIERQANMACDPLFGNIQDVTPKEDKKRIPRMKSGPTYKSSFTMVAKEETSQNPTAVATAQNKTCLYCKKDHATEACKILSNKKREEKVDFFKANGICFGCVNKGHLSKDCRKRLSCKICSLKHPTMLHTERKKPEENKKEDANVDKAASVNSSLVSLEKSTHNGAGDNQTLAIVPVQVKLMNSSKCVQTYAFLDPGVTATFCTTALQRQLNVKGKKTKILLRTLGQEKIVTVERISGLEVSNLKENDFVALPTAYTQDEIPVSKEQIPTSEALKEWDYLKEVELPHVDATIGLLIGTNAPKTMEPWKVISKNNGPYAVKTRRGWVVNGLLNSCSDTEGQLKQDHGHWISAVNLDDLVKQNFNHDFPEKVYEEKAEMSIEDKRFMHIMSTPAELKDRHYPLKRPFKRPNISMPNNRELAEQRAQA